MSNHLTFNINTNLIISRVRFKTQRNEFNNNNIINTKKKNRLAEDVETGQMKNSICHLIHRIANPSPRVLTKVVIQTRVFNF